MAYADIEDVQSRSRLLNENEEKKCRQLLNDAGIIIDSFSTQANEETKKMVSCNMVIRAMGLNSEESGIFPQGVTQGSQSALGYSQSWTISNGSIGELYISKIEKRLLRVGNRIGSYSPLEGVDTE